ncbi:MAG: SdpI family protein [Cyclobacteriaceae bacterium]
MQDRIIQLIASLALALVPIILYYFWREHPPKGINRIYGYRTSLSMKNEATWRVANDYAPKFLVPIGVSAIVLTFICFFYITSLSLFHWLVIAFLAIGLFSIIPLTEWHLHKHFDKDGNPKKQSASGKEP